jgi:restriction system protein
MAASANSLPLHIIKRDYLLIDKRPINNHTQEKMIPDYQTMMRPVLECVSAGEDSNNNVAEKLADKFKLTEEERAELLPSGKQTRFTNRVNWAKSYLKQAGLVSITRRGYFVITEKGREALADTSAKINNTFLEQFEGYQNFKNRTREVEPDSASSLVKLSELVTEPSTPDETLREAYGKITATLASELLDRVRNSPPVFFEKLIVALLLAMGYGGTSKDAGRALGQSGDDGIDGVIDQDPLAACRTSHQFLPITLH